MIPRSIHRSQTILSGSLLTGDSLKLSARLVNGLVHALDRRASEISGVVVYLLAGRLILATRPGGNLGYSAVFRNFDGGSG